MSKKKKGAKALATETKDAPASWGDVQNGWQSFVSAFAPYSTANSSGVAVSTLTALQSSAVYSCIKRLSSDIAKLPLRMMRRLPRGGWEEETEHPVAKLLLRPNRRMTRFEFLSNIVVPHQLVGNGVVAIVRNADGSPKELIPLAPSDWTVNEAANGDLYYHVSHRMLSPNTQTFRAEDISHIRNISLDGGINGASPIRIASEVLGLALATQQLAANTMRQGAHFQGALTTEQKLTPDQIKATAAQWEQAQAGIKNAGRTPLLQGGLKFDRMSMSAEEAQLLESRKFIVEEVCRLFGVPPFKVFVVDRATTGNNVEEQNQSYIDDTLMAITRPIEEALELDLLFEEERGKYAFRFDFNELLRGNRKDRVAAQAQAIQNGLMSVNEARAEDNRAPVEGGDVFRVQMNLGALENVNQPLDQPSPSAEEGAE